MGIIRIMKLNAGATIPCYQTDGAAGFDLHACINGMISIRPGEWREIPCGIAVEIENGYELQIRSRSGLAFKRFIFAYPGTIDADFRGELSVLLHNEGKFPFIVSSGDRIAQGVIAPIDQATIIEVSKLSNTERGKNGFGSTGI